MWTSFHFPGLLCFLTGLSRIFSFTVCIKAWSVSLYCDSCGSSLTLFSCNTWHTRPLSSETAKNNTLLFMWRLKERVRLLLHMYLCGKGGCCFGRAEDGTSLPLMGQIVSLTSNLVGIQSVCPDRFFFSFLQITICTSLQDRKCALLVLKKASKYTFSKTFALLRNK